jgi:hypothetical protein
MLSHDVDGSDILLSLAAHSKRLADCSALVHSSLQLSVQQLSRQARDSCEGGNQQAPTLAGGTG